MNEAPSRIDGALRRDQGGQVLAVLAHVLLLLLVIGQVVYLASRYRVRVDMTSDNVWTLTDSTQQLLDKLDELGLSLRG